MSVSILVSKSKALWFVIRTIELAPNLPNSSLAVSLHLICQQQGWKCDCDFVGIINVSIHRIGSCLALATSMGYQIIPAIYLTINTDVLLFSVPCLELLSVCKGLWGKLEELWVLVRGREGKQHRHKFTIWYSWCFSFHFSVKGFPFRASATSIQPALNIEEFDFLWATK